MDFIALIQGFATVFQPYNFILSIFAVAAGIMVGALPGLTATMACALLVPVTFGLDTVPAFCVLLGIYCGAIGYISNGGNMDTNIAIRTLLHKNQHMYFYAGGGIVYDSEMRAEYKETFDKAAAMMHVLNQDKQYVLNNE